MSRVFRYKKPYIFLAFFLSSFLFLSAFAAEDSHRYQSTINVLTWFDYMDDNSPIVKKIERQCQVNISHDGYYSNNEFLQRFQGSGVKYYDVIVYSDTISNIVNSRINLPDSTLYKVANAYHPIIREHYFSEKYPHNVLYYVHSFSGFLYNPAVIRLTPQESLMSMFQEAGNNTVFLLEDPTEVNLLLTVALHGKSDLTNAQNLVPITVGNFKKVYQNARVEFSDAPDRVVTLENFAFAYQWSGEAVLLMKKSGGKLQFLIHPDLSYISTDLIAETNTSEKTNCVARLLAGKEYLDYLQNKTYYISPYGDVEQMRDKTARDLYRPLMSRLAVFPWLKPLPEKQLEEINKRWDAIKADTMWSQRVFSSL